MPQSVCAFGTISWSILVRWMKNSGESVLDADIVLPQAGIDSLVYLPSFNYRRSHPTE